MTADIRHSPARFSRDRLLAAGGSLVLHGVAVAAFIAVTDGKPETIAAPSVLTMTLEWSAPPSEAAADASAVAEATPTAPADVAGLFAPRVDQAAAREVKPETPPAEAEEDRHAVHAATARQRTDAPPVPSQVTGARPQTVAPSHADAGDRAPAAIRQPPGEVAGESPAGAARGDAVAPKSPATPGGERSAWSVTSRRPPAYPMAARRRGIEGDVSLRVDVGADGRPRTVTIQRGSGDPQLDAAAMRAVEQWRFAVAAPMTIEIPIVFRLNTDTAEATQP